MVIAIDDIDVETEAEDLTSRQREVLRLVALGCTTKEIADRLSISARTAQWHISRLLARFAAPNRAALVRAAAEWIPT